MGSNVLKWLFITLSPLYCFASIGPISSIQEVEAEGNALVVFDIDDTLTILTEPAFHVTNYRGHHAADFKALMASLHPEIRYLAFSLPLFTTQADLIESHAPMIIRSIQQKGMKAIALSAAPGGKVGEHYIIDRRIHELKRVGIDFSLSFPEMAEMRLMNFPEPEYGSVPIYKNGVICANTFDKGLVLVEFLKSIDWEPDLIVFVDDRLDHVQAVEQALANFKPEIPFKGLHFQIDFQRYTTIDADHFYTKWMEVVEMGKEIAR